MTDGDRPLNNDWVLGPEPLDLWEAAFSWGRGMEPYRGTVRSKVSTGNVRLKKPRCPFCGAPTKWIRDKLFCRDCGYFESCCDGGKQSMEGER